MVWLGKISEINNRMVYVNWTLRVVGLSILKTFFEILVCKPEF